MPCGKGSTQSPDPPSHGEASVTTRRFPSLTPSGQVRLAWFRWFPKTFPVGPITQSWGTQSQEQMSAD